MRPPVVNPSRPWAKRVCPSSHRTWPSVTISMPAPTCSSMTSRARASWAARTSSSLASPRSRACRVFRSRKSPPSRGGFGYDPTTVTVGRGIGAGCYPRPGVATRVRRSISGLVERVPAGAGALSRGVVDGEPCGLEAIDEVDLGFLQVRRAHLVHRDLHPEVLLGDVAVAHVVVQEHGVAESGAATRLHRYPKHHVRLALLLEELLDLACRRFADLDHRLNYT